MSACGCRHCAPAVAVRFPFVTRASLGKCFINARLNIALWLAANGGEFRNYQIMCALKHALLTKRKGFAMAEVIEMF